MLFILDTMLNTCVDGTLLAELPWVFTWTKDRDYQNVPVDQRDHFALEAWERQTTGGVTVSAEYRSQMVKVRLARGLMKRALAEQDRQLYLAIDRAEAALCS